MKKKERPHDLATCDECGHVVDVVVEIGEAFAEEGDTPAWVCLSCLRKAVALLEQAEDPT